MNPLGAASASRGHSTEMMHEKTQFLVLTLSVVLAMAAPALAAQDQTPPGFV